MPSSDVQVRRDPRSVSKLSNQVFPFSMKCSMLPEVAAEKAALLLILMFLGNMTFEQVHSNLPEGNLGFN